MSAQAGGISRGEWENLRRRLISKVRFHLGDFCSYVEDLVQETLTRFHRALQDNSLRRPESIGAFLNGICNNVILEYRRPYGGRSPTMQKFTPSLVPHQALKYLRCGI